MPGEFDFIDWLRRRQHAGGAVVLPAGDDLAILQLDAADLLLVGVDQVMDGVHFDLARHDVRDVGAKVVNRNLSDCAAMACVPVAMVVALALPRSMPIEQVQTLYEGMQDAGDRFGCAIVGGDTGSWDGRLVASVSILGRSGGVRPVRRSGALPGQWVHVSGPLGGSILGRHLRIEPRIALARSLASARRAKAMIDLSDGLSRDAAHVAAESGVGIVLESARVPIHDDARALAQQSGRDPLEHALHDGEDHELLICSDDRELDRCTCIGRVVAGSGVWIERPTGRERLVPRGWQHTLGGPDPAG
jgi:thiamine-monophosphate kinase